MLCCFTTAPLLVPRSYPIFWTVFCVSFRVLSFVDFSVLCFLWLRTSQSGSLCLWPYQGVLGLKRWHDVRVACSCNTIAPCGGVLRARPCWGPLGPSFLYPGQSQATNTSTPFCWWESTKTCPAIYHSWKVIKRVAPNVYKYISIVGWWPNTWDHNARKLSRGAWWPNS